jgi:hypothetical protein
MPIKYVKHKIVDLIEVDSEMMVPVAGERRKKER